MWKEESRVIYLVRKLVGSQGIGEISQNKPQTWSWETNLERISLPNKYQDQLSENDMPCLVWPCCCTQPDKMHECCLALSSPALSYEWISWSVEERGHKYWETMTANISSTLTRSFIITVTQGGSSVGFTSPLSLGLVENCWNCCGFLFHPNHGLGVNVTF